MTEKKVVIVSGTNRVGSNTLHVAKAVLQHYLKQDLPAEILDLADLPREVFEPTIYAKKPQSFERIQNLILQASGLHIVTPEYNGSFPGILKYFIDLLKFPESFNHKPVAFVGLASGMFGALRSVEQLQMVFAYRNAHLYPDRVFISGVHSKVSREGEVLDTELDERLLRQAKGFSDFAQLFPAKSKPSPPVGPS